MRKIEDIFSHLPEGIQHRSTRVRLDRSRTPHGSGESAIVGLTLETDAAHVVRAGLEAMAHQTRDNVDALVAGGVPVPELRVDGGAAHNDFLCQFQADILGIPVVRPVELERTALGVAYLAGAGVGQWTVPDDVTSSWTVDRVFEPQRDDATRGALYDGWCAAVRQVRAAAAERLYSATTSGSAAAELT